MRRFAGLLFEFICAACASAESGETLLTITKALAISDPDFPYWILSQYRLAIRQQPRQVTLSISEDKSVFCDKLSGVISTAIWTWPETRRFQRE